MKKIKWILYSLTLIDLLILYYFDFKTVGLWILFVAAFGMFPPLIIYLYPFNALRVFKSSYLGAIISYLISMIIIGFLIYADFPWPLRVITDEGGGSEIMPMYVVITILITAIIYIVLKTVTLIFNFYYLTTSKETLPKSNYFKKIILKIVNMINYP